jgi:hypothetical protein
MSTIPTGLIEKQFEEDVSPFIPVAKRGYECSIPLHKVPNYILCRLHTGCQWKRLLIDADQNDPRKNQLACDLLPFLQMEPGWQGSIMTIETDLNLSELNLDGGHAIAKKGGEAVAYQGRKKAKTTNIPPITDGDGFTIATTSLITGTTMMLTIQKATCRLPSNQ